MKCQPLRTALPGGTVLKPHHRGEQAPRRSRSPPEITRPAGSGRWGPGRPPAPIRPRTCFSETCHPSPGDGVQGRLQTRAIRRQEGAGDRPLREGGGPRRRPGSRPSPGHGRREGRRGGFTPRQRHGEAICPPTCLPATGTDSPRGPGAPLLGFHGAGHSAKPSALSDGPPTVQTGRRGQNPAASPADTCAQGVGCDCTRSPCQTPRLRTPAGQEPESGLSGNGALGMDGVETSRSLSRCPSGALS